MLCTFKHYQKYHNTGNKGKAGISKHLWISVYLLGSCLHLKGLCQHCVISLQLRAMQQAGASGVGSLISHTICNPHDQGWSTGEVGSLQTVLSHHLESPCTLDKLRAQQWGVSMGKNLHRGLQSVLREVEHSANRDSGVHPAHLMGWQQRRKQLFCPCTGLAPLGKVWSCLWEAGRGATAPVMFSWLLPTLG